LIYSYVTIF